MSTIPYNLRELEAFRAVIIEGSTTLAAKRLGMSQPATSRAISQFEDKIGAKLFERSGGRLAPTSQAIALNENLDRVFETLTDIERTVLAPSANNQIFLASTFGISKNLVSEAIADFIKIHQDVEVVLEVRGKLTIMDLVEQGQIDIGIIQSNGSESGNVIVQPFRRSEMYCIFAKGHQLSEVPVVTIKDLIDLPLVGFEPHSQTKRMIISEFKKLGRTPKWALSTGEHDIVFDYVSRGLGVSVISPFPCIEKYRDKVGVAKFETKITRECAFVSSPDRPDSELAQAFRSHLRKFADKFSYSTAID